MALPTNINLDQPRWDQSTYWGRARHFFATTNPLNIFVSDSQLNLAKDLYQNYKAGNLSAIPSGTTEEDLWHAKHLYDSAFHPDTGEKMLLIGRMSAQVPMNMTITGCMMTFYKSTPAVVFWQWFNQSFNAVVNYTNRSGKTPIQPEELATSYVLATSGAVGTALYLNSLARKARPIVGRFVPFAAVAAANCINIPLMRRRELTDGVLLTDSQGRPLVAKTSNSQASSSVAETETDELYSTAAAAWGISTVVFVRAAMSAPGMSKSARSGAAESSGSSGSSGGSRLDGSGISMAALCWDCLPYNRELSEGLELTTEEGKELGFKSRNAATQAIAQVTASRIFMAIPNMIGGDVFAFLKGGSSKLVNALRHVSNSATESLCHLQDSKLSHAFTPLAAAWMEKRRLPSGALFQVLFCGLCLTFATPLCCALFSQRAAISVDRLEPEIKSKIQAMKDSPTVVYYNKGL